MKITLAKSAGFCFGVKRALDIAQNALKKNHQVCMLGDIVHNEDVVKTINQLGIKKIKQLRKAKDRTLLIRAHGAASKTFKKAISLGYKIIDATCPMVKEIHKIAKEAEQNGYSIIIIGDNKHDEVKGIMGQLKNKSLVIQSIDDIPISKIKKAAIVVQSTQNFEKTLFLIKFLKKNIKQVKIFNTICQPTRIKQKEIKVLPLKNDAMIIIGSKTSANTHRLFEISKSLNKKSYWINSLSDIKRTWFKNIQTVGITAGASTPDKTTNEIIEYLSKIK